MKRRGALWARSARRDLEAIVSYLADRNGETARSPLERLETRAKTLTTLADRGRVVPELARLHLRHYSELVVAPYRLVYRICGDHVLVLIPFDARRNLEDVLLDRLIRIEGQEQ